MQRIETRPNGRLACSRCAGFLRLHSIDALLKLGVATTMILVFVIIASVRGIGMSGHSTPSLGMFLAVRSIHVQILLCFLVLAHLPEDESNESSDASAQIR